MEKHHQRTIFTAVIFLFLQGMILIGFIKSQRTDHIAESISIIVLFLIYSILKIKYNLYVRDYITWMAIIAIVCHTLVGELLDVYQSSTIYDKILHVYGTYAFSLFFYSILSQLLPVPGSSKAHRLIFIIILGGTLGVILEIIEFLVDVTLKPTIPCQTDLTDTNLDLIANILGACMAAYHISKKNIENI